MSSTSLWIDTEVADLRAMARKFFETEALPQRERWMRRRASTGTSGSRRESSACSAPACRRSTAAAPSPMTSP